MISVSKFRIIFVFVLIGIARIIAQDAFQEQFNAAKKLYDEENYFDAVTEFKRLLFFDKTGNYNFDANKLIGLSYKEGAKFSDAITYLSMSEMYATTEQQIFETKIEIIKINILRRTTARAIALLDDLKKDNRFKDKAVEINYWTGWAYIFSDEWKKASEFFALIDSNQILKTFCDSVGNDLYSVNLAKALSIVPGMGQFYTGEYVSGLISIGWNVLWGYLTINAFLGDRVFDGFVIGTLLWWRFYYGNLQNAEKFATQKNIVKTNSALRYLQTKYNRSKP
jgi:hypothetical protein